MTISRWPLHRMRNVSDKSCRENQSTRFRFHNVFPKVVLFLRMSKTLVEPRRPQMAIWRRVACWISQATRAQAHASACAITLTHTHTRKHAHAYIPAHRHSQKYVILLFHASQCYVIRTFASLFLLYCEDRVCLL